MSSDRSVPVSGGDQAFLSQLEQYGRLVFSPVGDSMFPLLRGGRDVVVLTRPEGRLKCGAVALYRNAEGLYVLHRLMTMGAGGLCGFCGDNQVRLDPLVPQSVVLAVMTGFYRGSCYISVANPLYRLYAALWRSGMGVRGVLLPFLRTLRWQKTRLTHGGKHHEQG